MDYFTLTQILATWRLFLELTSAIYRNILKLVKDPSNYTTDQLRLNTSLIFNKHFQISA